jgi:dynein assembly factor 3
VKKQKKYTNFFDIIFISSALGHRINDAKIMLKVNDDSRVVVESATYIIDLKKEQKDLFSRKITEMAINSGLKKVEIARKNQSEEFLVYK